MKKELMEEIRRRRVGRVALVYAATAFAVIQAADVLAPALSLPEWTVTFAVFLAVLGLPLALVLAWVFEVAPEGIRRTEDDEGASSVPPPALVGRSTVAAVVVLLAMGLGIGWWMGSGRTGPAEAVAEPPADEVIRSVAVIPFANLSDDPANEYFSDGLAEELLNVLAQVEGLKVAARTSSWVFKEQSADVKEIAAALGVRAVVEGSVRRQDDRVRVTAQLIQASDGFHLWSRTYDSRMEDVFALQDSLAGAISEALRVTLGIGDLSRRERGLTEDVAAYDLYLLGRHRWAKRTGTSVRDAIRYYKQAITVDSTFALAYSGLADAWLVLGYYEPSANMAEALERAEAAITRALALSPDQAEVQATAGLAAYHGWDFERSEQHLDRALALGPGDSWTHHYRRMLFGALARPEEALASARRAHDLDPLSPIIIFNLGSALGAVDSTAASLRFLAEAASPADAVPYWIDTYARALVESGRTAEAEEAYVRWADGIGYSRPERAAGLASGDEAVVRAILEDVVKQTPFSRADLVFAYTHASPEALLQAATEAVDTRSVWALWLNDPRIWKLLGHDPRYLALLDRVGVPRRLR